MKGNKARIAALHKICNIADDIARGLCSVPAAVEGGGSIPRRWTHAMAEERLRLISREAEQLLRFIRVMGEGFNQTLPRSVFEKGGNDDNTDPGGNLS